GRGDIDPQLARASQNSWCAVILVPQDCLIMSSNLLLPEESSSQTLRRRFLAIAGTVILVATYLTLITTQPMGIVEGLGQGVALGTFVAYLAAAVLLLQAVLPDLPVSTLTLIPVALALNIILGQFVGSVMIPLYIDSIGT